MTTAVLEPRTHQFDVEDIEYLRHGDKPLLARVFRPRGEGPFPALVECHGGAWCLSDRTTERLRHEAMAKNGIVSIALDFRSGNEDPYPSSVQDTPHSYECQDRGYVMHDYQDADASFPGNEPQRFVANYRKAGGEIALEYIDAERHARHSPDLSKTGDMLERMVVFVHRHIKDLWREGR